jgi:3-dehydroquinate synthetase
VRVKAAVVAIDEREDDPRGGRALLNLGHTFAHAIEALPPGRGKPRILHGEAVGLGLIAACACARAAGHITDDLAARVRALLERCSLPTRLPGLPGDAEFLALMAQDKKVSGGRLRLVLPCGEGAAGLFSDVPEAAIRAGWAAIRA